MMKTGVMADISVVEETLRRWDPIGVMPGQESPEDEYNSYAPQLLSMLRHGSSVNDIRTRLSELRTGDMGLPSDEDADGRAAAELVDWWNAKSVIRGSKIALRTGTLTSVVTSVL